MKNDWHQADIVAALRKQGTSMAAISRSAGLSSSTLGGVQRRPWPKGEWLIGNALGLHPATIWPSRYHDKDGMLIDRKSSFIKPRDK